MSTDDGTRDSLFLLAPGLLHFLGNSLFAAQGRVQLLGSGPDLATDRAAIHDALERAGAGLHVLRWVLGDESQGPQGLWSVLQRLQETLRVSLRELGMRLELHGEVVAASATVLAAGFTRSLLAVVREMVHCSASGVRGVLVVEVLGCSAAQAELQIAMQPARDGLPFPLDLARCVERLQPMLARENAEAVVGPAADGLRLLVRRPNGVAATFP